jgi:predicted Zn-dependent peptidase
MDVISREVVVLPNGARIVFDPMPSLRTAAVGVWLAAGARHEPARLSGLAHFLEHMAFKAAGGRDAMQIAEAVEACGAVMNAATDYERTSYTVRCLRDDAAGMLDIALSLVFQPEHPEVEIKREKGVVLQEIGEAADQPDDLVFELAQAASYGDHALGRPVLGVDKTLKKITRNDLFGFAEANYTPGRVVVSVAGAYDRATVEAVARKWLADRSAKPAAEIDPVRPVFGAWPSDTRAAGAWLGRERDIEQLHLVLARHAPSAASEDRFAARLFAEIFGGGMASRLFQQVREEKGLAYTIDAACDQYTDAGRFTVYAGCAAKDAMEVARITAGIWADLAANGPTDVELRRAKAVMKAQFAMAAEGPAMRAGSAAYELLAFDRLIDVEEVLARIDVVGQTDVQRIAAVSVAGPAYAAAVGPTDGLEAAEAFLSL